MPIYDIAGLKVKINNIGERTEKQAIPYLADNQDESQNIDIVIDITPKAIEDANSKHPELNLADWEYMLTGNAFYKKVLKFNGFLLHASCVVVDDVAYLFSADSGIGKTTHTKLWLKKFGDKAYILNDDKPCIRIIDDKIYACGTPWSGTEDNSKPKNILIGGICFIERSEENWIKPADTKQAIFNVFSQTLRKLGAAPMDKLMEIIDKVFTNVPIYQMGCNMTDDAANLSYKTMKRDINEI